jgi:hypothetical protein
LEGRVYHEEKQKTAGKAESRIQKSGARMNLKALKGRNAIACGNATGTEA